MFYNGELIKKAREDLTDIFIGWKEMPNPQYPAIFHAVHGENLQEKDSPSWFNAYEVKTVIDWVQKIDKFIKDKKLERILNMKDVGIISPYHKQVKKIRVALDSLAKKKGIGVFG
jgi:superfamily I DNA and/or RNA helicase